MIGGFVAAINWRSQCPDAAEFVISAMVGTASLAMTIWGAIIIATRFSA